MTRSSTLMAAILANKHFQSQISKVCVGGCYFKTRLPDSRACAGH